MMMLKFNRSWCLQSLQRAKWQDFSAPQTQADAGELSGTSRPDDYDYDKVKSTDEHEEDEKWQQQKLRTNFFELVIVPILIGAKLFQ